MLTYIIVLVDNNDIEDTIDAIITHFGDKVRCA